MYQESVMKFIKVCLISVALFASAAQPVWAFKSCDAESSAISLSTAGRQSMSFSNQSSQVIKLYWNDFRGQRQLYSTLQPGQTFKITTYPYHYWIATNSTDDCLAIYELTDDGASVAITDDVVGANNSVADINAVLDLAEQAYAQFFPAAGRSHFSVDNWLVRYYPGTNSYVGVLNKQDVYVMGGIFGDQPMFVTTISILKGLLTTLADPGGNNSFSLTVKDRVVGGGGSVPADIDFQVGQRIEFTLTATELKFNGLTLPFLSNNGTSLTYALVNSPTDSSTATVAKTSSGGYSALGLYFLRGSLPFVTQINYTLE
jgi:hypothetical protein